MQMTKILRRAFMAVMSLLLVALVAALRCRPRQHQPRSSPYRAPPRPRASPRAKHHVLRR